MAKKSPPKTDQSTEGGVKIVALNRKARFNYFILENFEAGIVLKGWEIKSIRAGEVNINEAYVRPQDGEVWLLGAHINPYKYTKDVEPDPVRKRKLLLNRSEINKLVAKVKLRGHTIVPLKLYLKNGKAKIEIGVAKGKEGADKRHSIRDREVKRNMDRAIRGPKPTWKR